VTGIAYQLTRAGFSAAFGGASIYLAAAARRLFVGQMDWIRRGVTVEGEVAAMKMTGTGHESVRRKFYAPVVTFSTDSGEPREFVSARSTQDRYRFEPGQRVKVRYLPDDPSVVDLDELTRMWWPLVALIFASTVCAGIASLPFVLPPPAR
jgi:Protein of unknown function (DUF3592)